MARRYIAHTPIANPARKCVRLGADSGGGRFNTSAGISGFPEVFGADAAGAVAVAALQSHANSSVLELVSSTTREMLEMMARGPR